MITSQLFLPSRESKPRRRGLTVVIDGGLSLAALEELMDSAGAYVDLVKFGWGTALVTPQLEEKIALLRRSAVDWYLGGTLFEKHVLQGRFDDFRSLCHDLGCRYVEVSNGTIDLSNTEKAGYVRKLAAEFTVVSEVGFKDSARSERLSPSRWIDCIFEDLDAGAELVTLEARESGSSGICRPDGRLRFGLIEDVLAADLDVDLLLFEAPSTALQSYFVQRVGTEVNLGNVPHSAVIGLETLRLGLRSDTLYTFEPIARSTEPAA